MSWSTRHLPSSPRRTDDPDDVEDAMPGNTCPDVDDVIATLHKISGNAEDIEDNPEDPATVQSSASRIKDFVADAEDVVEKLRASNARLRECCEHALNGWRKSESRASSVKKQLEATLQEFD